MLDSIIARWRLRRLIRNWLEIRALINGYAGLSSVPPAEETRFLNLKAKIARDIPLLETAVPATFRERARREAFLMTELMNRYRTLQRETPMETKEREEFERLWHERFLFLNELSGIRLGGSERRPPTTMAGGGRRSFAPTGLATRRSFQAERIGAGLLRLGLQLVVLVAVVYVIVRSIGVHRDEAGKIVSRVPASANEVGANLVGAVHSLGGYFDRWLHPVIGAYGLEATLIMFGVLLLALGYWAFAHPH